MTTSNRLLPCPFCGGSAAYQRLRDGSKYGAYECGECGAQGPDVRTGYGPEEEWRDKAIAAWNERSSDTPPAAASVAACEPVAYAAFADNGNIQMWCKAGIDVACVFASTGKKPVPLYAAPPADAEPVAWIYEKYIGPSLTGEHPDGLWSPTRLTHERPHSTDRNVVPLYAAAHGDEAVRKDATEAVMQRACAELPEDWYIEIHLENGSGYATLFNDGIVVDFGQDFESFGAQVEAAIDAAMRAHSDREAQ